MLRALLSNWIVIEAGVAITVSPLAGVALARRAHAQSRDAWRFVLGVAILIAASGAVAAAESARDSWTLIAESQAVVAAAALALGAVGAGASLLFRDVLDAAASSLGLAMLSGGGVFVAGGAARDASTGVINAALLASPIVSAAAAVNVDLFRTSFLYEHSPVAHRLFAYPTWSAAVAAYLAAAVSVALASALYFVSRRPEYRPVQGGRLMSRRVRLFSISIAMLICGQALVVTQQPAKGPADKPAIQQLGNNQFRIGQVRINAAKGEVTVPGIVNDVTTLEFVACTKGGAKAYESAVTLDTNAVTFNAALLLIGLDRARSTQPLRHFDAAAPNGDAVEIWVETTKPSVQRFRAERLAFDKTTNQPIPESGWVYTGSTFLKTVGGQDVYLAESDGVLIGFVHDPATIIEKTVGAGLGRYGSIVLNRNLGFGPGTAVEVTVRALAAPGRRRTTSQP